jgi:hypothetical protein
VQQPFRTGLLVMAVGLFGVVLFVILLTMLNRNSVVLPESTGLVSSRNLPLATAGTQSNTPSLAMAVSVANELSTPRKIRYPQHIFPLQTGVQAPMTISSINHLHIHSSWITALTVDQLGRWWIGTEGQGVMCYNPTNKRGHRWQRFTRRNFAPNNVYAIVCDGMGRIWAGSLRHGVSVYNGKQWRNYDLIAGQGLGTTASTRYTRAGPLGQRVFGIAVSPVNGDVWIATAKGLTCYHVHSNIWQYYTRANGLPANDLSSLAFAPDGTLFVGTQCDGIAVGTIKDHYKTWTHIPGPITPAIKAWGVGLPDDRVNAIVVVPRGYAGGKPEYRVYAGTESGLAYGEDDGQLWQYIRGRNLTLKVKGLWHTPPNWTAPAGAIKRNLLLTDYVTALATDADGNIWIGHRTSGFEIFNQHNQRIFPTANSENNPTAHDFIASMAPLPDGGMLVGGYESGLFHVRTRLPAGAVAAFKPVAPLKTSPPLPAGARAPTSRMLNILLLQAKAGQGQPVDVASLGADWRTEGDWLGHYGVAYAKLCDGGPNMQTAQDQFFGGLGLARIDREASPHQLRPGDMRYYVARYHSQSQRTLYDPDLVQRVEGEWNDDGQEYARFFQGPDMWLAVRIPNGLYRLAFYFHNKDGEHGFNMVRDYTVQVYGHDESPAEAWQSERPLAQQRVKQFWGGLYTTFLLKGPGTYQARLARNGSLNMAVAGMFLDHIAGKNSDAGYTNLDGLPLSSYRPPDCKLSSGILASVAYRLWELLNQQRSYSAADVSMQWPDRVMAYRFAQAHGFPPALLARWRWKLNVWMPQDRQAFDHAIQVIPPPTVPGIPGQ